MCIRDRSTSADRNLSPAFMESSFVVTIPPSTSSTVSGIVFLNASYCASNSERVLETVAGTPQALSQILQPLLLSLLTFVSPFLVISILYLSFINLGYILLFQKNRKCIVLHLLNPSAYHLLSSVMQYFQLP